MTFFLERAAEKNIFKGVHPGEKALFAAVCLLLALVFSSTAVSLAVIAAVTALLLMGMKISWKLYLRLLMVHLSFLLLGLAAVALETVPAASDPLFAVKLGATAVGVTRHSLTLAVSLFWRAAACVLTMYFLALSTPFEELSWLLRKLKVPGTMLELMALTYRFIFVLAETAAQIFTAQNSRLGYSSWRRAFKSLGILAASLLVKTFHRSQMFYNAMLSRCYEGEMRFLEQHYRVSPSNLLFIAAFALTLVCLHLFF